MKEELLCEILEVLREKHPLRAKKLEKLYRGYQCATGEKEKKSARRRIYNYIYHLFLQQLSPKTRQELTDLNSCIGEDCYQIEQKEQGEWAICYDGAVRRVIQEDKIVVKNIIPREYKKGFHLSNKLVEEKEDKIKEILFFKTYRVQLEGISDMMDKKIDIQSGNYELRNVSIDRSFVELLIDFIGLRRVDSEKEKIFKK